jgi:hypothetical protein
MILFPIPGLLRKEKRLPFKKQAAFFLCGGIKFNYSGMSHHTGLLQIASFIASGFDFISCSLL